MIRGSEVYAGQLEEQAEEALGLAQWPPEDEAEGERGFDSKVRVLLWGSPAT